MRQYKALTDELLEEEEEEECFLLRLELEEDEEEEEDLKRDLTLVLLSVFLSSLKPRRDWLMMERERLIERGKKGRGEELRGEVAKQKRGKEERERERESEADQRKQLREWD